MDSIGHYFRKLHDDLIEQFKGKPNIEVYQNALARQLEELYAFFYELRAMRWINSAEGIQLDGIGNIVDLSRTDALVWSNIAGMNVPMDDELYRKFLLFKIFLNTSEATYADIVRVLKMFWPYTAIKYSEFVEVPATMFFTTPNMPANADLRVLQIVTRVKAAGVALHFIIPAPTEEDVVEYYATAPSVFIRQYIVCDEVEFSGEPDDFYATAASHFARERIVTDDAPWEDDATDYAAVGAFQIIKEVYAE